MKCQVSAFHAQRFETNYSTCVQVRAVKIYVAAVEALLKKKERGRGAEDRMKLSLRTKISY
jgi:hypothetical protein